MSEHHALQQDYANKMAAQRAQTYTRAPEPREQPAWLRHGYEPPRPEYEPIPEQQPHQREPMHNYTRTPGPSYGGPAAFSGNEHRFPPVSQPTAIPIQHSTNVASPFETALQQERQRIAQQHQEEQQRVIYGGPPQNTTYQQESPTKAVEDATRRMEEIQQIHQQVQRTFLGVNEMNRKGRVSPLPQAVQGAQGQIGGPGGEVSNFYVFDLTLSSGLIVKLKQTITDMTTSLELSMNLEGCSQVLALESVLWKGEVP